MKTIETWFLWLMIYSIIGWVYESTICSIGHRKLINRGFLNGPYCPDLRHGRGAGAARAGQDLEPGAAVFCRRTGDVQSGISDVVADGKAVPRTVVGLLEAEIQHRRARVPDRGSRLRRVLGGAGAGPASVCQEPDRPADGRGIQLDLCDFVCGHCLRPCRDGEGGFSAHMRSLPSTRCCCSRSARSWLTDSEPARPRGASASLRQRRRSAQSSARLPHTAKRSANASAATPKKSATGSMRSCRCA